MARPTSPTPSIVERKIGEQTLRLETGRVAGQADGAVIASTGETMLLATATSAPPRGEGDFFPLTVDVEERMYAAGKIPGGFFRREGKSSEKATLQARLIDRPMRPSFPAGFRNEVHCVVTILAVDNANPTDILAINAISAALALSPMPFQGPVGAVRLSHIEGRWVANATYEDREDETVELVIAGRKNSSGEIDIMMIEAAASEECFSLVAAGATAPDERLLAEGIEAAKGYIAEAIAAQEELTGSVEVVKGTIEGENPDYALLVDYTEEIYERVRVESESDVGEAIAVTEKSERRRRLALITDAVTERLAEEYPEHAHMIKPALRALTKKLVRRRIVEDNVRLDGRTTEEVRPIWIQTGVVPRVHGSALFTRGETQALSVATLGMQRMEQMIDDLSMDERKRYMHHYNFPPYSTGEAGFMRGPKRRDIGHGALAEKSLLPVVPTKEDFPYALRVVSEILSSNGSTSMASVCGS
ncbi:MAG TPA: polyribonucleotide nucleotidyltransferase, partial [Actinomycetota bacterium]|nr:polyribonucleotide nucleotidyltransferase [Actinomycetota bacterium]